MNINLAGINFSVIQSILKFTVVTIYFIILVACGGGGSNAGNSISPTNQPMVDSWNSQMAASFDNGAINAAGANGIVASGAPISNVLLTITDNASHSVSTTTDANGKYHARIDGFVPPLVAVATLAGGSKFHSVSLAAPVSRGFINLNVTSLTDMLASNVAVALLRNSPADLTPALIASKPSTVANETAKLVTYLTTSIKEVGLDPATFDPVSSLIDGLHIGHDKLLDNLSINTSSTMPTTLALKFSLGGTVSGLRAGNDIALSFDTNYRPLANTTVSIANNGTFVFPYKLKLGTNYYVWQVVSNGYNCSEQNNSGTVSGDITNVIISCGPATSVPVAGGSTGTSTGAGSTGAGSK